MNAVERLLAFALYSVMLSVQPPAPMAISAPELFGDASAYVVDLGGSAFGVIFNDGYAAVITGTWYGRELTCEIRQAGGVQVVGAEAPVPCYVMRREDKWIGWIDFRGHQRKFCAGPSLDRMPATCRLGK